MSKKKKESLAKQAASPKKNSGAPQPSRRFSGPVVRFLLTFVVLIGLSELAQWRVAALLGAPVPIGMSAGPAILVSVLCFPVAAFLAAKLDRWRIGR